jgi:uncharacterized alpha-E superfamily protein
MLFINIFSPKHVAQLLAVHGKKNLPRSLLFSYAFIFSICLNLQNIIEKRESRSESS